MTIRTKTILIVLPLILTPLILTVLVASLSARNGITIIATDFLGFKAETFSAYMNNQWSLLEENGLSEDEEYLEVAKRSSQNHAKSLIQRESELILAVDPRGEPQLTTRPLDLTDDEKRRLAEIHAAGVPGWQRIEIEGLTHVGHGLAFEPFDWYFWVLEPEEVFYGAITEIFQRTAVILTAALLLAVIMLIIFTSVLTRPIKGMVAVIREIITTGDLGKKVTLRYRDETGELGHYFNLMTGELDKAYNQIKKYAFEAVMARNNEKKVRKIFQRYVPSNVIEQFEAHPETMLKGDNRELAVLFSDIRSFTTISENMHPETIVESLNKYFETMVDIIMNEGGIVDKYIGDAIMAFFGAPVKGENDPLQAVLAALNMISALREFNRWQQDHGLPPFDIGIGINYGEVTVGNIGSERKMDYTVIGDMVNLASRLEGLTKYYHEKLIVSESVKKQIEDHIACRLLDRVAVKGKARAVKIYTVREALSEKDSIVWAHHSWAMEMYLKRSFKEAAARYEEILTISPGDSTAKIFLKRCREFESAPPPENWQGETIMDFK